MRTFYVTAFCAPPGDLSSPGDTSYSKITGPDEATLEEAIERFMSQGALAKLQKTMPPGKMLMGLTFSTIPMPGSPYEEKS